jgi:hypothetical protein
MTTLKIHERRRDIPGEVAEDCPTAWFALLESAMLGGDSERAARARRELQRLGVVVIFRRSCRWGGRR